jgi:hypothetical protein
MAHSSKDIEGKNLDGWNAYGHEDEKDFNTLGITEPSKIITEDDIPYAFRILVASSITGARPDIDISAKLAQNLHEVTEEDGKIKVSSFLIDANGRGFFVETIYISEEPSTTMVSIKADNNYRLLDDGARTLRDYAIRKLIESTSDTERSLWISRLDINGLEEEAGLWLSTLLDLKLKQGKKELKVIIKEKAEKIAIDVLIDNVLKNRISLEVEDGQIIAINDNGNNGTIFGKVENRTAI